jgi:hypothetical protein
MVPPAAAAGAGEASTSLREELRSVLFPEVRWHYAIHLLVVVLSSAYWAGSLLTPLGGSLAETVLYRSRGDSQLWPVITSLSHFNFGDPTDAFHYGEGVLSFPVASMLPYSLACAVFGPAGYIVGDLVFSWVYLVAITLLLRRCGVGALWSLAVGCALATGGLQALAGKFGEALNQVIVTFGTKFALTGFPNLLELPIYTKRIQRPMVTEIFLVLLLWMLVKVWRDRRLPSLKAGLGIGVLLGLLMQGDFYATGTMGLLLAAVTVALMIANRGKLPWRLIAGAAAGAALASVFFVYQRVVEHPDVPRRAGLAEYSRTTLWLLPGFQPLVRLGIVGLLMGIIWRLSSGGSGSSVRKQSSGDLPLAVALARRVSGWFAAIRGRVCSRPIPAEAWLALFFGVMMVCAYLAQPVQLFLLGKGAQIYHYQHSILIFYAYAVVVLALVLLKLGLPEELRAFLVRLGRPRGWSEGAVLGFGLMLAAVLAVERPLARVKYSRGVRGASETYEPWGAYGDAYRPALRHLDGTFRTNATLGSLRSITSFNPDVYVLLTAFHGKRAYNPDVSFSTLSDSALEDRLLEAARICGLNAEKLVGFLQTYYINCNFLGSNKYRFATDNKFSDDSDYPETAIELLADPAMPRQWGWLLAIPQSELRRLVKRFEEIVARAPVPAAYPDAIVVMQIERDWGLVPSAEWYVEIYRSNVFSVYTKKWLNIRTITR